MDKELYLIQFETQKQADFWLNETAQKFSDDIILVDRQHSKIEFPDSVYYFWNTKRVTAGLPHETIVYTAEDLYIILDDPERKKLSTWEEPKQYWA